MFKPGKYGFLSVMLVFALLLSLALAGCGTQQPAAPAKPAPLKIGIAGPMKHIQGDHMWRGAVMAAEEINAAGGVKVGEQKRPLEVVKVDTNEILNVPDASSAVERAITVDKVDYLVGGFRTEAVLGMQDVAAEHKKIFLSVGATHPQTTQRVKENYSKYKYYFRANPFNSVSLGKVMFLQLQDVSSVVKKELGIEKPRVAIVAENAVWAEPIVAAAKQQIPAMGLVEAGTWRLSPNASDTTAELTAIRSSGAQIIFTAISGTVCGIFARQWEELQVPAATVGVNVDSQGGKFWQTTGGKGNYTATVNFFGRVASTPKTLQFYDSFMSKNNNEIPIYTGAGAYDAVYMLAEVIGRAGKTDSDSLVPELEKIDYLGIGGRRVFTPEHDLTWGPKHMAGVGTQWQDGKLVVFWPSGWEGIKHEGTVNYVLPPWMVKHWKK